MLGNRTYGELIRAAFAASQTIAFDAHWSTESHDRFGAGKLGRQLDRVFLKMFEWPAIRKRNLDLFALRYEIGTSYWALRTLRALLRDREPAVLHVHTQAIALLATAQMKRIPTIVSADGTAAQMARQQLTKGWRWTFAGNAFLERRAFRRAAGIVAFSRWAADSIVAEHGVDPARVHVIAPGVDLAQFPDRLERTAHASETPVRVLFVGGEFERKGGPQLVAAFLRRFADDPGVELDIVTRAASVAYHPRIRVHTGVAAYSDAWHAFYRSADLFVMPTKRDQSPIVFLEAMAAGLPVITTPVGSAAEVVLDGETGFVVPHDNERLLIDRMAALVADAAMRARFGAAGRAHVERNYEARANARKLEALFVRVAR